MTINSSPFVSKNRFPFIIAGPCSAETEQQVHDTISKIVSTTNRVSLIRAGVWKPRTRPESFEGVGKDALKWLKSASKEYNVPIAIEVANTHHVELALKMEIDVLWIGARTTVNPFQVQEIANALKGYDIPVMIKNPVSPDLDLWIGAIERLHKSGIEKLAAIHRGFFTYEKTKYRNVPNWEIPIELRRRFPTLPIICDPSHIAGKSAFVPAIAQKAMDLMFDGLMIETHIHPKQAWSDAKQQISPDELASLLDTVILRQKEIHSEEAHQPLQDMRAHIDRLDNYILELLAERMSVADKIGLYKEKNDIAIHQPKRWAQTVQRALEIGQTNGLSDEFILALFQKIHNESILHQMDIIKEKRDLDS